MGMSYLAVTLDERPCAEVPHAGAGRGLFCF